MSLTKPRAHQLFDIDYKQAVRVLVNTNVTLSGGAPSTVDGVVLAANDRVLVISQDTASQNGLYQVVTAGAGSNGTWARSQDADATGELLAGAVVMVTEGDEFADTQWKLITNNPVVIGVTALEWEQNSAYAFGNIFANGTAVLANSVGDTLTLTAGNNIAIVGNAAAKSVVISVTGISLTSISNGTSNVSIIDTNGDVTTAVNGNTIMTVTGSGANVIGSVVTTGNISGGNVSTVGQIVATGNISGGNLITTGVTSTDALRVDGDGLITGNLTIQGNLTYINVTDLRVQDPIIILGTGPNGAPLTQNDGLDRGIYLEYYTTEPGNAFVGRDNSSGNMIIAGNVEFASNDVVQVNSFGTLQAGNAYLESAEVVGNVTAGNITTGGTLAVTGNISGGNLSVVNISGTLTTAAQLGITSVGTLTSLTVTGNVESGNTISVGAVTAGTVINAVGNVTGGNLVTAGNVTGGNLISVSLGSPGNTAIIGANNALTSTSSLFVDTANNRIGVGTVTPERTFDLVGNAAFTGDVQITQFNNSSDSGGIRIRKSRGADNAPGAVLDNDIVGAIEFFLRDTSSFQQRASITSLAQVSGATYGADLAFGTGNGAGPTTRLYIAEGGAITFNNAYTFPTTDGSTNNVLVTNGTGTLSFTGTPTFVSITATGNVTGGNLVTAGLISAVGNVTGGNLATAGNVEIGAELAVIGTVTSNLVPTIDATYSLGNATNRWSNLFLTGNTIQLGNIELKDSDGALIIFQSNSSGPSTVLATTPVSETTVFADGSDFGSIDAAITIGLDLGLLDDIELIKINLGTVSLGGVMYPNQFVLPSFTVAELANTVASPVGQMVICINEISGTVPAFSDGTDWRRVTDRAVVS